MIVMMILIVGCTTPDKGMEETTDSTGPITIGFVAPLTGDGSSLGLAAQKAVELAVKETNAAGGINGREVKVIYEDGKCNPKDGSSAGNKLINIDKVPVIVGGLCSSETMAIAPIAESAKVVMLSGCSSNPSITNAGDYIFRDYPSDSFQGVYAAGVAKNKLNAKKAAVVYCLNDWCAGLAKTFKESFEQSGGKVVMEESFNVDTLDMRTQLTKIKEANPDMIYFLGMTEASIAGLKQRKELGISTPTLGGDGWDDPVIWTKLGGAGDGVMWTVPYTPASAEFEAKLLEIGAQDMGVCTPQFYDAAKLVLGAMKKVGIDSSKIKDELYTTKDYQGISGTITLDSNGDLVSASYVTKVAKEGKGEVLYPAE